jgi:hypothetical protein
MGVAKAPECNLAASGRSRNNPLFFRTGNSFAHLVSVSLAELLFVRGVIVAYEAIRKRCRKFGQAYANQLRRRESTKKSGHIGSAGTQRHA